MKRSSSSLRIGTKAAPLKLYIKLGNRNGENRKPKTEVNFRDFTRESQKEQQKKPKIQQFSQTKGLQTTDLGGTGHDTGDRQASRAPHRVTQHRGFWPIFGLPNFPIRILSILCL